MLALRQILTQTVLPPIALLAPAASFGQEVRVVRDPPTCEGCEVRFEHVVTLGEREGPGRVGQAYGRARDSRGNYYIAHGDGGFRSEQIWVFDSDGTFVRTIGRAGEGPGEYREIQRLDVLPGDTLVVHDARQKRRTTLSPDLTVLETQPFEVGRFSASVSLPSGQMVVVEHQRTPGRLGYPLQLVSQSGGIIRSFGASDPEYRSKEPYRYLKSVALGPDAGSVWSVGKGDYLIELWDTAGIRRAAFQREAEWFEPFVLDTPITPDGPKPQAMVGGLRVDSSDRLWVTSVVASDDWREAVTAYWEDPRDVYAFMQVYDTILEIIDPISGELLVSQRLSDIQTSGWIDEDLILSYREDELGYPFLDVYRISLHIPPQHPWPEKENQGG